MRIIIPLLVGLLFLGCSTVPRAANDQPAESPAEAQEALRSIAGSLAQEELSDEEFRALAHQVRTDEEARTAVQEITGAISEPAAGIKYCPQDGKRYSAHLKYCPGTKILLKDLE